MGHNSVLRAKHGGPLAEIMMSAVNRPPLVATIGKQAPWMMTWRTVGGMERNLRCSARAKAQSRARQREKRYRQNYRLQSDRNGQTM